MGEKMLYFCIPVSTSQNQSSSTVLPYETHVYIHQAHRNPSPSTSSVQVHHAHPAGGHHQLDVIERE